MAVGNVCYIISGTVKISVALVLYRLAIHRFIRVILIADMVICCVCTILCTLILGLGCMDLSPYTFRKSTCQNTNYSQESLWVVFDFFHVGLPIVILWDVKISRFQKLSIICLFGVGLL